MLSYIITCLFNITYNPLPLIEELLYKNEIDILLLLLDYVIIDRTYSAPIPAVHVVVSSRWAAALLELLFRYRLIVLHGCTRVVYRSTSGGPYKYGR